jgi:hypothetical protein
MQNGFPKPRDVASRTPLEFIQRSQAVAIHVVFKIAAGNQFRCGPPNDRFIERKSFHTAQSVSAAVANIGLQALNCNMRGEPERLPLLARSGGAKRRGGGSSTVSSATPVRQGSRSVSTSTADCIGKAEVRIDNQTFSRCDDIFDRGFLVMGIVIF